MTGISTNSDASENFDAELAKEAIATGEEKAIEVNVDADYEASKQFSVSEIDKTGAGEQAAAAATSNKFELKKPADTQTTVAQSTSDPAAYRDMANEVGQTSAGSGEVTDSLVEKAIQKGQAGGSGS